MLEMSYTGQAGGVADGRNRGSRLPEGSGLAS